jgi:hypothetical protein
MDPKQCSIRMKDLPLLTLLVLFFTSCAGTQPRRPSQLSDPLGIAMKLYAPPNLGSGDEEHTEFYASVSARHKKVAQFYSNRLNHFFDRWIQLDLALRKQLEWSRDGTPADSSFNFYGYFTTPVIGGNDIVKSMSFSRSTLSNDPTISVRILSTGPQNHRTDDSKISLRFIMEDGRYVVDDAEMTTVSRHTYMKPLKQIRQRTLDQQIANSCRNWKRDVDKLNAGVP